MEYLALIYGDETVWESLQPDERAAAYEGYAAFASTARDAGVLVGGDELRGDRGRRRRCACGSRR